MNVPWPPGAVIVLHLRRVSETISAPPPIYCTEKMRLLDEFVAAVADYLKVESARLKAAVRGDEFLFDGELEAARNRKEAGKEVIRAHHQEHGC